MGDAFLLTPALSYYCYVVARAWPREGARHDNARVDVLEGKWKSMRRFVLVLAAMAAAVAVVSGAALADIIDGTNGDDTLMGTAGGDIIDGKDGDDSISGRAGGDTITGGAGADTLVGGNIEQTITDDGGSNIDGGYGPDTIAGSSGADILHGGPGDDMINEGPLDDGAEEEVYGEEGADTINVASYPAYGETVVNCGPDIDHVQADPLDKVMSNCENVEVFDPDAPDPQDANTGGITPQAVAEGHGTFVCYAPGYTRGTNWCARVNNINYKESLDVGTWNIRPDHRGVFIRARGANTGDWLADNFYFHEESDPYNTIFHNYFRNSSYDVQIRARADSWFNAQIRSGEWWVYQF